MTVAPPLQDLVFEVDAGSAGQRLDKFLSQRASDLSRSQIQKLIKDGHVEVTGAREVHPKLPVRPGAIIRLQRPEPQPLGLRPQPMPLRIIYEDEDIVVLNKAAGVVVHPGSGREETTLVHALLHHCQDLSGIGGVLRPGIVHRLDKDTSGLLVVAKNDASHRALVEQFKTGQVKKNYLALAKGQVREQTGEINQPLGRHPHQRKKMSTQARQGKPALTRWEILEVFRGATLLSLRILTGRTHQIRAHMEHLGHPLLGDPMYGGPRRLSSRTDTLNIPRQMLHARRLEILHPSAGTSMAWEAPLPEDMETVLAWLRQTAR